MDRWFTFFEDRSRLFWLSAGTALTGLLGVMDTLTGYELSFSLFYLAPIVLAAWFSSRQMGWLMSVLGACTWLVAELAAGQSYSQPAIHIWNTLIRFGFFAIVTHLVANLRSTHDLERMYARRDFVSGAMNARQFTEMVELQINRSRTLHQPFTLAYIDLDNFKAVNDTFGHKAGDELIRFIAWELKSHLRTTDFVARMGGDEFAILLPSLGQLDAERIIGRLHTVLTANVRRKNMPVTLSVGAVICTSIPESARELIGLADALMYTVKNSSKNDIRFAVYQKAKGQSSPSPPGQ